MYNRNFINSDAVFYDVRLNVKYFVVKNDIIVFYKYFPENVHLRVSSFLGLR
jgi:hypothetical protein